MHRPMISLQTWMTLSSGEKSALRHIFTIPRSGGTEVAEDRVISDGTTAEDVSHLTVEKMQAYLGSEETDIYSLFNSTMKKVLGKLEDMEEAKETSLADAVTVSEVKHSGDATHAEAIINAKPKTHGKGKKGKQD